MPSPLRPPAEAGTLPADAKGHKPQVSVTADDTEKSGTMNAYKISGTSRQVGAIGLPEPFERIIPANTAREAYAQNRDYLYSKNREHVLTMKIEESRIAKITGLGAIGTAFAVVDPELYL